MKIPTSRRCLVAALFCLLLIAQVSNGQSGRKTPPQPPAAPARDGAFVPDPNRDEYQLVFTNLTKEEKAERRLGSWERREYHAANFSEDVSRVGAQGYRLVSVAMSPRLAVMRRADHQYEYSIVKISSRQRFYPNNPQFARMYEPWARKGFRVREYFVSDGCEYPITNDPVDFAPDCSYYSTAILERRLDVKIPHAYDIVSGPITFSKEKLEGELLEELNSGQTRLYVTHLITKFQLLRQSPSSVDDLEFVDYDVEIVSGDMIMKRVNALAQVGYRLIMRPIWFQAAVLHRKKGATDPASYILLTEKKLERELPRLQEQGAIYRMNNGCMGYDTLLIFEQPSVQQEKKREYKFLEIELKELDNAANKFEIVSGSNSAIQELNRMSKDGFVVRDFVGCRMGNKKRKPSRAKILLERAE